MTSYGLIDTQHVPAWLGGGGADAGFASGQLDAATPPCFTDVEASLPTLMDERLAGTRKTKHVAQCRPLGHDYLST